MAMNKGKLTPYERQAALYVRQSSSLQVKENTGSTAWQMALVEQLGTLGWPTDRVQVFSDLGTSGEGGVVRGGFYELLEQIRLRKLGVVMVVEETRIARNEEHWGRLMDVMARTDTLFFCNDQLLDLNNLDDRLEASYMQAEAIAESQERRLRLHEGRLALAQEGKYKFRLPAGYNYDDRKIIKSADGTVRGRLELVFKTFEDIGTANGTAHALVRQGLDIPRTNLRKPSEVIWTQPTGPMITSIIRNPLYSGTYVYGRSEQIANYDANYELEYHSKIEHDPEEWTIKLHEAFEGYITWERYLQNRKQLAMNGFKERSEGGGAAREGRALLQGIIYCGACGTPLYPIYGKDDVRYYVCHTSRKLFHEERCKSIRADWIDSFVSDAISGILSDCNLQSAINNVFSSIKTENIKEKAKSDQANLKRINRELERAKRSVAEALRKEVDAEIFDVIYQRWKALRHKYEQVEKFQVERHDEQEQPILSTSDFDGLSNVASLFAAVMSDNSISMTAKKNIVRCIIERVEVVKKGCYYLVIHWQSGFQSCFYLPPRPRKSRVTPAPSGIAS